MLMTHFYIACDSSCTTCAGSATFCLTCSNSKLASSGGCVSSCPANTFSSAGACLTCHPDCGSCSGSSFNQCLSCASERPVLTNGRCLPTCSISQFFDPTSSTCQSCDSSCASCSGSGPSNCLACSSSDEVLHGGSCVSATCTSVVPGLGVCLANLVQGPSGTSPPLPSITGLNTPVIVRRPLEWWQILLMTLGCAFIFVGILVCWRRRARKQRAKQTAKFASAKSLDNKLDWRLRLVRFGERLFGHENRNASVEEAEELKLAKMRNAEEARHYVEMEGLMGSNKAPSSRDSRERHRRPRDSLGMYSDLSRTNSLSADSLYSQMTGLPRQTPEPRQPVKNRSTDQLPSRFSATTFSSSVHHATEAESYARAFKDISSASKGAIAAESNVTGGSRNPFRK